MFNIPSFLGRAGGAAVLAALLAGTVLGQTAGLPDPGVLREELQKISAGTMRVHMAGVVAVITDLPDAVGGKCVTHLHAVLPRLRALAQFPPDSPVPDAAFVALFEKRSDFQRFLQTRRSREKSGFVYLHAEDPARRCIAAYGMETRPLLARLRHAAFDCLLRAWIPNPPPWLSVGFGECMEDAALDAQGRLALGPPRGHLRDLRERVLEAQPSARLPLKDLVLADSGKWTAEPFAMGVQAWGFARFLLEDPEPREACLAKRLLAALSPQVDEKENLRNAARVFVEDEWAALETAWSAYVVKLVESPGEESYRQARELLARKDYEGMIPLLDNAIRLDPDYERLYYFRALASFQRGKFAVAGDDLDKALALFPEYHAARFLRGQARSASGNSAGAQEDFQACLDSPYRDRAKKELEALK